MSNDSTIVRVSGGAQLAPGETRAFPLPDADEQGFLIATPQGLRAYRNRCAHWPAPLDMDDGRFFNPDMQAIQCSIHGALFRPEDGFCTWGPCSGGQLKGYEVSLAGSDALVIIPR